MKIKISPTLLLFLCLLSKDGGLVLLATVMAALFHECGHLLASVFCKIPLRLMEIDLFGARLYPKGFISSYKKELSLAAAGPLFSILLGLLLIPRHSALALATQSATFSLAFFNLLPIADFDGGRMLRTTLALALPEDMAERILAICSYVSLFLLFSLSACMLLKYGQNLALTVLCVSLFAKIFLL